MPTLPDTLTLLRPDDLHLHVRDGAPLHTVVPHSAAQFARALIMPNLKPPVTTVELAQAYAALEHCPVVMSVLNKTSASKATAGYGYGYGYGADTSALAR